jgi:hypothetical protein
MGFFLGFDPGGRTTEAFGWALLCGEELPLTVINSGTVYDAKGAFDIAISIFEGQEDQLTAVGIDAPLFWQPAGGRVVDQMVRNKITGHGSSGSTVNDINSLRGSCLIQGMMTAMLLRRIHSELPVTEAHPKALLWLLGVAGPERPLDTILISDLSIYMTSQKAAGEHERDAALGAVSAFAMVSKLDSWQDLYQNESNPITPLAPPPGYWMPL